MSNIISKIGSSIGRFRIVPHSIIQIKSEGHHDDGSITYTVRLKNKELWFEAVVMLFIDTEGHSFGELYVQYSYRGKHSDGYDQIGKEKYALTTLSQKGFIEDKLNKYLNSLGIPEIKDYVSKIPTNLTNHPILEQMEDLAYMKSMHYSKVKTLLDGIEKTGAPVVQQIVIHPRDMSVNRTNYTLQGKGLVKL